ncbi:MAG: STM3941 family protein, partial [Acidobacteriota bacterium]
QILDSRPRIIIDDQGILDRTLGVGLIPWNEIDAAYLNSINGNYFISLELRNPEIFLARLSNVQRKLASANRALGFSDINVNLSGVDKRSEEIFKVVTQRCLERSYKKSS